jgi:hypothetical protein
MYAGIGFLDAVRASSIGLQNGKPPTSYVSLSTVMTYFII